MADEAAATQDAPKRHFSIEGIYLKDLSLETPQGIKAYGKPWAPRIDMDINTTHNQVGEDLYEVMLRITITVKDKETEDVIYLLEIQQGGAFKVSGFNNDELRRLLATSAPTVLFPYARETVDSMSVRANFPPLKLAPINFDQLLLAAMERQKQAENQSGSDTLQ